MTRRSFDAGLALTVALMLTAGGGATQDSSQIDHHSLFSFIYERGQVRLDLAKNAASLVKEMRLEIYSFEGAKVFDSGAVVNQPLVWSLQDQSGAAPDGNYICSIQLKTDGGESGGVFARLTKSAQGVRFIDAVRLYMGDQANGAREFFKRLTGARPDDASAWLWYGQTLCKPSGLIPDLTLAPPPPPPPPPTPATNPSKKKIVRVQESQISTVQAPEIAPSKNDFKEAVNAFQKALDLAVDCKTKDRAIAFLAYTYSQLGADAEETEAILKRTESECATTAVKASSYYSLGVKHWDCAYSLSRAYRDGKKDSYDPFHYRNFTNLADKRKFNDCLTKSFEFIDKALLLDPEYVEAIFYKGLLCRERQKTSKDKTERRRWEEEALKLLARGTDLQRKKVGR